MWHVGGKKDGYWQAEDVMMIQPTLVMQSKDKRGKMFDNAFIGNRLDSRDWEDSKFTIEKEGDSVVWRSNSMQFTSRPPYWEIKGSQMGVEYDLLLGGIGTAIRSTGLWENLKTTNRAGYDHFCWVEGSITVEGKKYILEKGYGIHERFSFGGKYDPVKSMKKPYNWVAGIDDLASAYFFVFPDDQIGTGRVSVGGNQLNFGMGEITVEETEIWVDPLTLMNVPVKWKAHMKSKDGQVELDIAAGGRGIYTVASHSGTTLRYAFSLQINGSVTLANGETHEIKDLMSYMEWGKTTMPLPAGI
jgi:hypothetical protein